MALGIAIGSSYEVVEWTLDNGFGTNLIEGEFDTGSDLLAGAIGSAGGGVLLVVWSAFGWGTVRRLSADALATRTPLTEGSRSSLGEEHVLPTRYQGSEAPGRPKDR